MTQQELDIILTMNQSIDNLAKCCEKFHVICSHLLTRLERLEETVGLEQEWRK